MSAERRVLILGGGFGGVRTALSLTHSGAEHVSITLISDKPHHEFTPGTYRIVTGASPKEVCIPLRDIFSKSSVQTVCDSVTKIDIRGQRVTCASGTIHEFDILVLALGTDTAYFDIPGLKEFSHGFKTIAEASALRRHIENLYKDCNKLPSRTPPEKDLTEKALCLLHFVIVGAGASGVQVAGELASCVREFAGRYQVDRSLVTIDLLEAAPRILPSLPEKVAEKIAGRLRSLGINIFVNRALLSEEFESIKVRGMSMKTETVIWTAGLTPNHLYRKTEGLVLEKSGRVQVDTYLRAAGTENIFIAGDGAETPFSGTAQTAIMDGRLIGQNIARLVKNAPLQPYVPKKPRYSLPVGTYWAATLLQSLSFYGVFGWILRKGADIRYYFSILPVKKAFALLFSSVFRRTPSVCAVCDTLPKSAPSRMPRN